MFGGTAFPKSPKYLDEHQTHRKSFKQALHHLMIFWAAPDVFAFSFFELAGQLHFLLCQDPESEEAQDSELEANCVFLSEREILQERVVTIKTTSPARKLPRWLRSFATSYTACLQFRIFTRALTGTEGHLWPEDNKIREKCKSISSKNGPHLGKWASSHAFFLLLRQRIRSLARKIRNNKNNQYLCFRPFHVREVRT